MGAGSSAFQSLFGGATTTPAQTSSAAAQQAALNTTFTGMTGTLTSGISMATSLSPDLASVIDTSALTTSLDKITALQTQCKDLTPEQCSVKQVQLQAETDAAQLKFYQDTLAATINKLMIVRDKVQSKYDAMLDENETMPVFKAASLLPQYEELLSRIKGDITVCQKSVPYIVPQTDTSAAAALGLGSSTSSGSSRPAYELPSVRSKADYEAELDALDDEYDALSGNPLNPETSKRQSEWWYNNGVTFAYYGAILLSTLWGGVVSANIFIRETFLGNRLFYIIYGMLGWPFVLLYIVGCGFMSRGNDIYWTTMFPMSPRIQKVVFRGRLLPDDNKVIAYPGQINDKGKFIHATKIPPSTILGDTTQLPKGLAWEKTGPAGYEHLVAVDGTRRAVGQLPPAPQGEGIPSVEWIPTAPVSGKPAWELGYRS